VQVAVDAADLAADLAHAGGDPAQHHLAVLPALRRWRRGSYFIGGAMVTPRSLPPARVVGWIGSVLWPSGFLFLCLLLLLFPTGGCHRHAGSRSPWRSPSPGAWSSVHAPHDDPTGRQVYQLCGGPGARSPHLEGVAQGAVVIAVATLAAAALAPLLRFRRADPMQRQQLKWFAFGVGISR
jgi:hypothetical protein